MPAAPPLASLRVLVAAEDPLARAALAQALKAVVPHWEIAGVAPGEAGAREADCLLWDLGLEPAGGLEALRLGLAQDRVVLALAPDDDSATGALTLGARAALRREAPASLLATALQALAQGLVVLEPAQLARLRQPGAEGGLLEPLTPREREVLDLLAEGLSNRAIAQRLAISEHTAKFHVNAVLGKLGAQKRVEAVVRAARLGVIHL